MKKFLLATAALAALSTAASAADLPRKSVAPVIAIPMFTWTGFYVGLNAGYGWGETKTDVSHLPSQALFGAGAYSVKDKPSGFIGGAQLGYNQQFGAIVLGIEGDFQFSDVKRSSTFGPLPNAAGIPTAPFFGETSSKMQWFGTIRGRLGFTPVDRLLVYATGGVMFADMKYFSRSQYAPGQTFNYIAETSSMKTGWVVGLGAEYAFTNNLTAKLEYMYYDLGSTNNVIGSPQAPNPPFATSNSFKHTGNLARVGINYKF